MTFGVQACSRFGRPNHLRWIALALPVATVVFIALYLVRMLDCEVACDGQEAVSKARATDFDLILMDVQMPRLDGLAAARQLCGLAQGSPPMIVALTANVFAEDMLRCLAAGMSDFLAKPVDPGRLYATLLDVLNRVPRRLR